MTVQSLVAAATAAANAGRWDEAQPLWAKVLAAEPGHPGALFALGLHAQAKGRIAEAHQWLTKAVQAAPRDVMAWLALAANWREQGQLDEERHAIEQALVAEPYSVHALLCRAAWHERAGQQTAAASDYRNALKIAPPERHWPPAIAPQLRHARQQAIRYAEGLREHLDGSLSALTAALDGPQASRWREAVAINSGLAKPQVAQANQLYVPQLPARPFFEPGEFPGLERLVAATDVIRRELEQLLAEEGRGFTPYIHYQPGEPVNQWAELNHSTRWSAYHLWQGGQPRPENLARCPETAAVLQSLSLASIDGLCPNVLFSALAPGTHIPPHHGETNARLVAHLPLIVPPDCHLRVGNEWRQWTVGEPLVFDDTLEHEARNDSGLLRVVLIFDLWNPLLSATERSMVNEMAKGIRGFRG